MIKNVLYFIICLETGLKLLDVVYLIFRGYTNIPILVLGISGLIIAYGLFLIIKRFFANVTLRQMMSFFIFQAVCTLFNLGYIAAACPFYIGRSDTLMVGTFLGVIVDIVVIYYSVRHRRNHYFSVEPVNQSGRNV